MSAAPQAASPRGKPRLEAVGAWVTAHQYAKDSLRHAIITGSLPAGARLVQADLAAELGVSTTPIREALRDLVAEGLIVFDPHRGALVRSLDIAEVKEVYAIRRVLEPLAVRMATGLISRAEAAEAISLIEQMDDCADPAQWVQLNTHFHSLLEAAARSPRLGSMIRSLQDIATRYLAHAVTQSPERMSDGNAEHRALLAAIIRKNADEASAVMVRHVDATLDILLDSWPAEVSSE